MSLLIPTALLAATLVPPAVAADRVPQRCLDIAGQAEAGAPDEDGADARWNELYRNGFRAVGEGDYGLAEQEMCAALIAARGFGPRDWRFAETLDELGLINFQLGRLELAEAVQGAAVAEMLLALGPRGEPARATCEPFQVVKESDCRSSVRVYIDRLEFLYGRLGEPERVGSLHAEPWRIFEAGYLPLDDVLAHRLDWLISQYLLEENLPAAEALARLRAEILER